MNSQEFVSIVNELIDKKQKKGAYKIGRIPSNYTSGDPQILFDGENTPSGKTYKCLNGYSPLANERVLLARVSNTYVVLGGLDKREFNIAEPINGWEHYSAGTKLKYRKAYDGEVSIEGSVKGTTSNTVVFTLPIGYRPATPIQAVCTASGTGSQTARVLVGIDGIVKIEQVSISTGINYVNLSINFMSKL